MAIKLYPPQSPFGGTFDYAVVLDDSKPAENGNVLWYSFPIPARDTAAGETAPQYQTRLQALRASAVNEIRGLARLEVQQRNRVARQLANQDQTSVDIT